MDAGTSLLWCKNLSIRGSTPTSLQHRKIQYTPDMSTTAVVRELVLPDWMTLDEASDYLRLTRQGVSNAAIRLGWERRRIADVVLLARRDVERYRRSRQLSGPRRPSPPAAAAER